MFVFIGKNLSVIKYGRGLEEPIRIVLLVEKTWLLMSLLCTQKWKT